MLRLDFVLCCLSGCELGVDGGGWFGFWFGVTCWFYVVGCDFSLWRGWDGVEGSKGDCVVENKRGMVVVVEE